MNQKQMELKFRWLILLCSGLLILILTTTPAIACTVDNWNGGATGSVSANGKSYEGFCGAKIQIAGQNLLTDLSPSNETLYVASVYAFLGEMSLGEDAKIIIFSADQGPGDPEVLLRIDREGSNHRLVLQAFEDGGGPQETASVAVNYGWNQIQLWWAAASAPGANDGFAHLNLNGADLGGLSNLDNYEGAINQAQLGRIGGTLNSPSRFFDVDLFHSSRVDGWVDPFEPFNDIGFFAAEVMNLYNTGITSGCGGGGYCPNSNITRAQMAVFINRAMLGSYHSPPSLPGGVSSFSDIDKNNPNHFATWVEEFFNTGITSGCATNPLRYCPDAPVTRGQMAVFLLRGIEGAGYTPPPLPAGGSSFADIDEGNGNHFAAWVEDLADRGITGGCGGGNYCPMGAVTRGQMAAFIERGFGLPLTAGEATNSN